MNVLIVDDEEDARENLGMLLQRFCPQVKNINKACSVAEALEQLKKRSIHLVFLDIHMPGANGFELLGHLAGSSCPVIITSAFHEYALKAIKFNVLDYLLKPIDITELKEAVVKVRRDDMRSDHRVLLNQRGQQVSRKLCEVLYCEADSNYTIFHFTDGEKIVSSKTLKEYEAQFGSLFIRAHSKYLVNLEQIERTGTANDTLELKNGVAIPVSRRRKTEILALLRIK